MKKAKKKPIDWVAIEREMSRRIEALEEAAIYNELAAQSAEPGIEQDAYRARREKYLVQITNIRDDGEVRRLDLSDEKPIVVVEEDRECAYCGEKLKNDPKAIADHAIYKCPASPIMFCIIRIAKNLNHDPAAAKGHYFDNLPGASRKAILKAIIDTKNYIANALEERNHAGGI